MIPQRQISFLIWLGVIIYLGSTRRQSRCTSLELMEKMLGEDHPSTLASMNNLASVLDSLGVYEEAEAMLRQTLELKEKVLGEDRDLDRWDCFDV
jgi:hypothetical protein